MVGLDIRVRPERGQLIITEKTAPFLHYPMSRVQQTDEGGVISAIRRRKPVSTTR